MTEEENKVIDNLPDVDYFLDPRRVIHCADETAGIVTLNLYENYSFTSL